MPSVNNIFIFLLLKRSLLPFVTSHNPEGDCDDVFLFLLPGILEVTHEVHGALQGLSRAYCSPTGRWRGSICPCSGRLQG